VKRVVTVILALMLLNSITFAQFGKLSGVGKKPSGGAVDADSLVAQANAINADFLIATYALANSYAAMLDIADKKEEAAKLRDAIAHAKAEPVDGQAKFLVTPMDDAQRTLDVQAGTLETKKLNDKEKRDLARISFNVAIAVLKDKSAIEKTADLLPKTQDAVKQATSDPTAATKLNSLKGAATVLNGISQLAPTQIKSVTGTVGTLAKMRKINNISDDKVATATATSSFDAGL